MPVTESGAFRREIRAANCSRAIREIPAAKRPAETTKQNETRLSTYAETYAVREGTPFTPAASFPPPWLPGGDSPGAIRPPFTQGVDL